MTTLNIYDHTNARIHPERAQKLLNKTLKVLSKHLGVATKLQVAISDLPKTVAVTVHMVSLTSGVYEQVQTVYLHDDQVTADMYLPYLLPMLLDLLIPWSSPQ